MDFKNRMKVAAKENSVYQEATKKGPEEMRRDRDKENCFRISELGIPNHADVVVLGKPQMMLGNDADGGEFIIGPPDQASSIDNPRFYFRILKGHTIDNLMKHRAFSLKAYLGFAGMGMLTIEHGLSLMRDSMVLVV